MQVNFCFRWMLVSFLVVSLYFLATHARRGGGGRSSSSRGSSSRSSYSRPSPSYSRPSPSYSAPSPSYSRPSPSYSRPAPAPAPRPAPAPAPAPRPAPAPAPKPPSPPVVVRQPAYNPNFKESNPGFGAGDRQPAYNPNYNPGNNKPAGPPPPYSRDGHSIPNAPVGPPPSYQSSNQQGQSAYPKQPPPYSGPPGQPPAYPGLSPSYPVHAGSQSYPLQPSNPSSYQQRPELNRPYVVRPEDYQPKQVKPYPVQPGNINPQQSGYPGNYAQQPGMSRPYPVQPGSPGSYPQQSGTSRPYPVQPGFPGSYPQQPGMTRPYPVQPGYPGASRPYPQQSLGANVWQPHHGMPAPSYMNYGGIPTGTNMYTKPHKKQGFLGSLMSLGKNKSEKKKNKYYGSYPSPYGISTGKGYEAGGFLGKHGSSAAMHSIFPYMVAKKVHKIHKPKFGFYPLYTPHFHYRHHYHHYHSHDGGINPEYSSYFDVYNDSYVGKCQQPIKTKHKVTCSSTFDELTCVAKCEEGYKYPNDTKSITNKCWHVTGVWKPKKNYPECLPVCDRDCQNGGKCVGPNVCQCPAEYRGSLCQFYFLKCNILSLIKEERLSWVCNHTKTETVCRVRCKDSAEFDLTPPAEYRCTPEGGQWTPDTLPVCDAKKS